MNEGFRGTTDTLFPQQVTARLDTKIQFCLAGVKNVDNSAWYTASDEVNMKTTLDEGGMETLNVFVNNGGGNLGKLLSRYMATLCIVQCTSCVY